MSWNEIAGLASAWTALVATAGIAYGRHRGAAAVAQIKASAHRDPLTGLLNRAGLEAARLPQRGALIALVDLDDFKAINDTLGHRTGDAVLSAAGRRLGEHAAEHGGIAARLGGDEFVVLLPASRAEDLLHSGSCLLRHLTSDVVATSGTLVQVRASVGLSQLAAAEDLYDAIHRADLAMYQAKKTGTRVAATPSAAKTDEAAPDCVADEQPGPLPVARAARPARAARSLTAMSRRSVTPVRAS